MRPSLLLAVKLGPRLQAAAALGAASNAAAAAPKRAMLASAAIGSFIKSSTPSSQSPSPSPAASPSSSSPARKPPSPFAALIRSSAVARCPSCEPSSPLPIAEQQQKQQKPKAPLRIALRRTAEQCKIVRVGDMGASLERRKKEAAAAMSLSMTDISAFASAHLCPRLDKYIGGIDDRQPTGPTRLLDSVFSPPPAYVGLVACGVSTEALALGTVAAINGGGGCTVVSSKGSSVDASMFTVGVNFAIHRLVNASSSLCSSSSSSQQCHQPIIAGLLKGCAEQNALGAFAAKGTAPFTAVKTVVLHGRHVGIGGVDAAAGHGGADASRSSAASSPRASSNWWASMFPCRQCWSHLCAIAEAQHQQHHSHGDDGGAPQQEPFTVVITMASMAEVALLKEALAAHLNTRATDSASRDEGSAAPYGCGCGSGTSSGECASASVSPPTTTATNSTLTNSPHNSSVEWFLKRHQHLVGDLLRPAQTFVVPCNVKGGVAGYGNGSSSVAPLLSASESLPNSSSSAAARPRVVLMVLDR